jgi:hypothetical protein
VGACQQSLREEPLFLALLTSLRLGIATSIEEKRREVK